MAKVWGKKAKNRQLIINAAKELFENNGTDRVTFNDIAEAAGMSRTTIFNHFPTISSLMVAMCEEEAEAVIAYSETCRAKDTECILHVFNKLIDDVCDFPKLYIKLISIGMISEASRDMHKRLGAMVRANLSSDLSEEDKDKRVILIGGSFLALIAIQSTSGEPFDRDEMKRKFASLVRDVLK